MLCVNQGLQRGGQNLPNGSNRKASTAKAVMVYQRQFGQFRYILHAVDSLTKMKTKKKTFLQLKTTGIYRTSE